MKYLVFGKVLDSNDEITTDNYLYTMYEPLPYLAFCIDCDKVLYPCRTQAGAEKVCNKHMGYKKYAGHKAEVRYEKTKCTTADIVGTQANIDRNQQIQAMFKEKRKQERQKEETELLPKIDKIVEALGVQYNGQAKDGYGSALYNFSHPAFHVSQIKRVDIDIAYEQITGQNEYYNQKPIEETITMVWYRISKGRVINTIPESTNRSVFIQGVMQ